MPVPSQDRPLEVPNDVPREPGEFPPELPPPLSNERQPEVSFPGRKSAEVDLGDADPLGKPSRS